MRANPVRWRPRGSRRALGRRLTAAAAAARAFQLDCARAGRAIRAKVSRSYIRGRGRDRKVLEPKQLALGARRYTLVRAAAMCLARKRAGWRRSNDQQPALSLSVAGGRRAWADRARANMRIEWPPPFAPLCPSFSLAFVSLRASCHEPVAQLDGTHNSLPASSSWLAGSSLVCRGAASFRQRRRRRRRRGSRSLDR